MNQEVKGLLGLAQRAGFLYTGASLCHQIEKGKIYLFVEMAPLDIYHQESLQKAKKEPIKYIKKNLKEEVINITGKKNPCAFGISSPSLGKKVLETINKEEDIYGEKDK